MKKKEKPKVYETMPINK